MLIVLIFGLANGSAFNLVHVPFQCVPIIFWALLTLGPRKKFQATFIQNTSQASSCTFPVLILTPTISPRNPGPFIILLETEVLEWAHCYQQPLTLNSILPWLPSQYYQHWPRSRNPHFCFLPVVSSRKSEAPSTEPLTSSTNCPFPSFPISAECPTVYIVSQGKNLDVVFCFPHPCQQILLTLLPEHVPVHLSPSPLLPPKSRPRRLPTWTKCKLTSWHYWFTTSILFRLKSILFMAAVLPVTMLKFFQGLLLTLKENRLHALPHKAHLSWSLPASLTYTHKRFLNLLCACFRALRWLFSA